MPQGGYGLKRIKFLLLVSHRSRSLRAGHVPLLALAHARGRGRVGAVRRLQLRVTWLLALAVVLIHKASVRIPPHPISLFIKFTVLRPFTVCVAARRVAFLLRVRDGLLSRRTHRLLDLSALLHGRSVRDARLLR